MYQFDDFSLDPRRRLLLRAGRPVPLTSKAFDTLLLLIERRDRVVTKEELLRDLWPRTVVEESNLSQNVFMVRKALGQPAHGSGYIVTVPGTGYRFAATVREALADAPQRPESTPSISGWSRGVWIAVAVGVVAALGIGAAFTSSKSPNGPAIVLPNTVLIADFENRTGESAYDGFLRRVLSIELEQSPYLKVLPDTRIAAALERMQRSPQTALTQSTSLEICERENVAAVLAGAITRLNRSYVVTLEAIACGSGDRIASEKSQARSSDEVLNALDAVGATMRRRLGESLSSIEKYDRPLREATTTSLEALKAFTSGADILRSGGDESRSIPLFERAIDLDADFALAYSYLAVVCGQLGESARAASLQSKAFALRDRVSEHERLLIVSMYHFMVTGDLDEEVRTYELWRTRFPHDWIPATSLADIYGGIFGDYTRAAQLQNEAWQREPKQAFSAPSLASSYLALDRAGDAAAALGRAMAQDLDGAAIRAALYRVAIIQANPTLADEQRRWSALQRPEDNITSALAAELVQRGQMKAAHEMIAAHVKNLTEQGLHESAANLVAWLALCEAEMGESAAAARTAEWSVSLAHGGTSAAVLALTFALTGDETRTQSLLAELRGKYPHDFSARRVHIPLAEAALAISQGRYDDSIATLEPLRRYDLGYMWSFLPPYLRGLAYAGARRNEEASDEFQKIVSRRGVSPLAPEWALANLRLAETQAALGNHDASRAAFGRLGALWKDGDAELAVVRRARLGSEYVRSH